MKPLLNFKKVAFDQMIEKNLNQSYTTLSTTFCLIPPSFDKFFRLDIFHQICTLNNKIPHPKKEFFLFFVRLRADVCMMVKISFSDKRSMSQIISKQFQHLVILIRTILSQKAINGSKIKEIEPRSIQYSLQPKIS